MVCKVRSKCWELDTADEMGVCRGYVGVFIDSPDTQTHDL